jgi:hypothetical protein
VEPRVFLICVNRLVCEAVNLLLRREGIELLGIETDSKIALSRVRALQPNVVLVEGDGVHGDSKLMAALTHLVCVNEGMRIIRISLNQKELNIYRQEQRQLINTKDLVSAIRLH